MLRTTLMMLVLTLTACCTSRSEEGPVYESSVYVDSVELVIMESWPLQVGATIEGRFSDEATTIREITQQRNGDVIFVTMHTQRDPEVTDIMKLIPFTQRVPIDVRGLPAGTYTVECNGVTTTFTLDMDNVPQQELGM